MAGYRFYQRADKAQDAIWRHTLRVWGEPQAIAYIRGLHLHLAALAQTPRNWRKLQHPAKSAVWAAPDIYFSRYGQHFIFFRRLDSGDIGIMSILHARMDIPKRLSRDLAAAEREQS